MTYREAALALAAMIGYVLASVVKNRIDYEHWLVRWTRAMNDRAKDVEAARITMLAEEGIPDGR